MYDKYQLRITVPSIGDEYDVKLNNLLQKASYRHEYWDYVAPPVKRSIILNGLSSEDVERAKNTFREMYKGHKFVASCSFQVISEDGQVV